MFSVNPADKSVMKWLKLKKFEATLWVLRQAGYNVKPEMIQGVMVLMIYPNEYKRPSRYKGRRN